MQTRQWALSLVGGLTVMSLIGCYSHYPSSVYGPGGQPGVYGVPPGGAYPQGGSYVLPPGTPVQGSGTSLGPSGSYESQSPSANGSDNRWQPPGGSGSEAPAYSPTDPGKQNPVPDYNDPSSTPPGGDFDAPSDFGNDTEDFGGGGAPAGDAEPTSPFGEGARYNGPSAESNEDGPFVSVESELMPVTVVNTIEDAESPVERPSPYKYDQVNFRWLRGVVDFDSQAKTWNIIYNLEPDEQDQYGGSIVLSGVGQRESLQNGDVVLVEGEVDPKRLDPFGKPMFRVDRLIRLEPLN